MDVVSCKEVENIIDILNQEIAAGRETQMGGTRTNRRQTRNKLSTTKIESNM